MTQQSPEAVVRPSSPSVDTEKVAWIVKTIRRQNWKNGGILAMDVDEAEALVAQALSESTAALEGDRDALCVELSATQKNYSDAKINAESAEAEVARLREALERIGKEIGQNSDCHADERLRQISQRVATIFESVGMEEAEGVYAFVDQALTASATGNGEGQ
jgi:hypothetical protein